MKTATITMDVAAAGNNRGTTPGPVFQVTRSFVLEVHCVHLMIKKFFNSCNSAEMLGDIHAKQRKTGSYNRHNLWPETAAEHSVVRAVCAQGLWLYSVVFGGGGFFWHIVRVCVSCYCCFSFPGSIQVKHLNWFIFPMSRGIRDQ